MGEISIELDQKTILNLAASVVFTYLLHASVSGVLFSRNPFIAVLLDVPFLIAAFFLATRFGTRSYAYILLADVLIASFVINLNVTLNNPIIFGDEGYYAGHGRLISRTHELPRYLPQGTDSFREIFTDAPLFFVFIASFFSLGGEGLVRFMGPMLAVIAALLTFLAARRYSPLAGALAALFLLSMPSFVTYTTLLYNHLFAASLFLSSLLFLQRYFDKGKPLFLVGSSVLGGLSILSHQAGILIPVVYVFSFAAGWLGKDGTKKLLLLLAVFTLMMGSRYLIYNLPLTGYLDIPVLDNVAAKFVHPWGRLEKLQEVAIDPSIPGLGGAPGGGVYQSIFRMNILNFIEFAYSMRNFIIAVIGASYMFTKKGREDRFLLLWLLAVGGAIFYASGEGGGAAETTARALLFIAPPLAIAAGLAASKVFEAFHIFAAGIQSRYSLFGWGMKGMASILILLLFATSFFPNALVPAKASSLAPIKQFSAGFFKGCDWIRENTPEDSYLLTVWESRAFYACERKTIWTELPDHNIIVSSGDKRAYDALRAHGIDYVYIQKFSISRERHAESYPVEFVLFLENNKEFFEKVYENEDVIVYKVI